MAVNTYVQFTTYSNLVTSSESQINASKFSLPSSVTTQAGSIFEVDNLTFDIEQTLNIGSQSSGAGAGKVTFNPLQMTRKIDAFSPSLFQMCCSGTAFKFVRVFLTKSTGAGETFFLLYTFKLVAVKEIVFVSSDESPSENVTFEYGGLTIDYSKENVGGSFTPVPTAGWNRVRNIQDTTSTTVLATIG